LEYCTAAWSPHYVKDKELLEEVQHRFTNIIPEIKELEYKDILKLLGLITLEERRNRSDLVEMLNISRKMSAIPFEDLFDLHSLREEQEVIYLN
jgi:hypothetical protein